MLKNIKNRDEVIGKEAQKGDSLLKAVAEDFESLTKQADVSKMVEGGNDSNVDFE